MKKIKEFFIKYYDYILILYVPIYIAVFLFTESVITPDVNYWVSYTPLDSVIPFCEYFVIPYYLWYFLMLTSGISLLIKNKKAYRRFVYMIIIGFSLSIIIFYIFPNGQNLRPTVFERDNFCTRLVKLIYESDTNTNVLPSIHVYGSIICPIALFDGKPFKSKLPYIISVVLSILICLSTVFIKQHSVLDIYAGIIMYAIIYMFVYNPIKKVKQKFQNKSQ